MRYVVLFMCVVSLFSCRKKEGPTTVEGIVIDEPTGQPLTNFKITLYSEVTSFGSLDNGKTNDMKNMQTDANGHFFTSFEADDRHNYFINLPEVPFTDYCQAYSKIKPAEKNMLEIKAKRSGTVKLSIINEAPVDTAEEFYVSLIGGSRQNYLLKDTTAYIQSCAGKETKVNWRILSKGKLYEGEKTATPGNWDTAQIEIRF